MVHQWTTAATALLRKKITRGEINPNILIAAYLGDVVSGEHFPDYEAPHLRVTKLLLSACASCSGTSSLNENIKAAKRQQEKEKEVKIYHLYYQLYFACVLNQIFIIIHADEGSDDSNNKGVDIDKGKEGNKDKEEEKKTKIKTKKCLHATSLLLLGGEKNQRHPDKMIPKQDDEEA
jgi:hypothetical protein